MAGVAGCAGADPPPRVWGDGAACPTREISGVGLDPGFAPGLKNGVSALATSPGVWNRRSGSLAIILATSAASSTGTSGRDEVQRLGVHRVMRLEDVVEARPLERRAAGQEVVERAAQAVDVGADVGLAGVADLLRGDVVGRAEHLALVRQRRRRPGPSPAHLGQAEVEHLDHRPVPLAGEHQVARLDVAVDHAVLVGVLQAQRRLVDEVAGMGHRQRPARLDQLGQVVGPRRTPWRRRGSRRHADGRVGGDDVGVMELGRGADLAEEALEHARAVHEVRADDLEDLRRGP